MMQAYPKHTKHRLAEGKITTGTGMRTILSGSDLSFILAGGRERTSFLNARKL